MEDQIKEIIKHVDKREKEEWDRCQKMHEKFGSNDKLSEIALARWSQWNDVKYLLKTIKI